MIRRQPTLIPMTDEDVQDVRDMAKQKTDLSNQSLLSNMTDNSSVTREDVEMKDGVSKAERLGLDSGPGMFFHYLSLTNC